MKVLDRDLSLRAGAWLLVLLGSFANLVNHHDYPLLTPEVLIVAAGLACFAIFLGLVHRLSMPRISFAITGCLTGLAVDFNQGGGWGVALGATAAGLALAYFFDRIVLNLLCAAFAVIALFQVAQMPWVQSQTAAYPPRVANVAAAGPPAIVHIVLDAHLGVEGMREDDATFSGLRRLNEAFFRDRGFRLYGGAYSEHRNTVNSLPAIFSFGKAPLATEPAKGRKAPEPLDYFVRLERLGYRTQMRATDFLDLCAHQPVAICTSRPVSHMAALTGTTMSVMDRARTIAAVFLAMAQLPQAFAGMPSRLSGDDTLGLPAALPALTAIDSMKAFEPALAEIRNGDAFVTHFIFPHDPFVLDQNCQLQSQRRWLDESGPVPRAAKEAGYGRHMRCALTKLDRLLSALERSPAGRNAVVIIHGDHGSRLADQPPRFGARHITTRDFAMTYSTLFAVRGPGIPPGYDSAPVPVSYLLKELSLSEFRRLPRTYRGPRHVILADFDWVPRQKAALPQFGLTTY